MPRSGSRTVATRPTPTDRRYEVRRGSSPLAVGVGAAFGIAVGRPAPSPPPGERAGVRGSRLQSALAQPHPSPERPRAGVRRGGPAAVPYVRQDKAPALRV